MSEEFRREMALAMMQQQVAKLEFRPADGFTHLVTCIRCAALVHKDERKAHCDWHDEVLEQLQKLQKLLENAAEHIHD